MSRAGRLTFHGCGDQTDNVVVDGKLHSCGGYKGVAYNPNDGRWDSLGSEMNLGLKWSSSCVIENVIYYYYHNENIKWYDTKVRSWRTLNALKTEYTIEALNTLRQKPIAKYHTCVTDAINKVEDEMTEIDSPYVNKYVKALGIYESILVINEWVGKKIFKQKNYAKKMIDIGRILQRNVDSAKTRLHLQNDAIKAITNMETVEWIADIVLEMKMVVMVDTSTPAKDTTHYCEQHKRTLQAEHRWKTLTEEWSTYPPWIASCLWDRMHRLAQKWQFEAQKAGEHNRFWMIGAIAGILLHTYRYDSNENLQKKWKQLAVRSVIQRKERMAEVAAAEATIKTACILNAWNTTDGDSCGSIIQCAEGTPHEEYIKIWVENFKFVHTWRPHVPLTSSILTQEVNVLRERLDMHNQTHTSKPGIIYTLVKNILTLLPTVEEPQRTGIPQRVKSSFNPPSFTTLEKMWDDMADIAQRAAKLICTSAKDGMKSQLIILGNKLADITFHGMTQTHQRLRDTDLDVSTAIKQKWKQRWNVAELLTNDAGRADMAARLDHDNTPVVLKTLFKADLKSLSDCLETQSSFDPMKDLEYIKNWATKSTDLHTYVMKFLSPYIPSYH